VYQSVARDGIVGLLREHLRANLLKLGRSWHYQRTGIPQARLDTEVQISQVANLCHGLDYSSQHVATMV